MNQTAHYGDTIGWNACLADLTPNAVVIGPRIHPVEFVFGDMTVKPLNLRTQFRIWTCR
jgi:hypothetical protein